jgi:hypothetical protein
MNSRPLVVVTDFLAEAGPENQVLSDLADLRLLQTNDEAEVARRGADAAWFLGVVADLPG